VKNHSTLVTFLTLLAVSMLTSPVAGATLAGQTVETTYLFPDTATAFAGPTNAVVGTGVELPNFAGFVNIDFRHQRSNHGIA